MSDKIWIGRRPGNGRSRNSLVVRTDPELAYYKASSLISAATSLREISPDENAVVGEDGAVLNVIKKTHNQDI